MGLFSWFSKKNNTDKRARLIEVGPLGSWDFGAPKTASGKYLTPEDALTISAVHRGINLLSDSVSMLPIRIYKRLNTGGKDQLTKHPLWNVLKFQPNLLQDSGQFFHQVMTHLILRGNFYAQVLFDRAGRVTELWPLNPDNVIPHIKDNDSSKGIFYGVHLSNGERYDLDQSRVLHIRTLVVNGLKGLSPIELAMRTVDAAISQEEHAAAFYGRGVKATGMLEHPGTLSAEAADRLRESFENKYGGPENAYRTILLEEGMKFSQVSLTAEQSQFIQTRQFTVTDFARWLGIPPHLLYELSRATFSNIEQQGLDFLTYSLQPWLVRIERALIRQLLSPEEWQTVFIEFLADAITRTDIKTRSESLQIQRQNGVISANEWRAIENMNPIDGDAGDIYLQPSNFTVLGTQPVDNQSKPEPAEDPEPNPPEPASNSMGKLFLTRQLEAFMQVIHERIARALRREISARQRKNGDGGKMEEYLLNDLKEESHAATLLFMSLLNTTEPSSLELISRSHEIAESALKEFAAGWLRRSNEAVDKIGSWEVERAKEETALFAQIIRNIISEGVENV